MNYYLGVDVGGTNIKCGITNECGEILCKQSIKTEAETLTGQEIISNINQLITDICAEYQQKEESFSLADVKAIGVGSPGTVDNETGALIFAGNLYAENWNYRELIKAQHQVPVYVVNDANAAALAESRLGVAKGTQSSITITLGTGVGGGVIIDDRVFSGFNGAGSELGHAVIVLDGIPCTCGRKGCFERYASATALIQQTKQAMQDNPNSSMHQWVKNNNGAVSGRTAFEAMKAGDKAGREVVEQYVHYLAEGIANFINCFMPEMIIIGGGVSNEGEYFLRMIEQKALANSFLFEGVKKTRFAIAGLGNDAGISGAALYAKDCLSDGVQG